MARNGTQPPATIDYKKVQWVLDNLSSDQLRDMDEKGWDGDHILGRIQQLVEGGWKVSIKWDYYSGSVQATAIQMEKERPNAGFALAGRSIDVLDCLQIVVYKHDVVAQGNLSDFRMDESNLRG